MTTSSSYPVVSLVLLLVLQVRSNYRYFHVDNADICDSNDDSKSSTATNLLQKITGTSSTGTSRKPLSLGTGAAIFQLRSPSSQFQPYYRNKPKRCEIHLKAPSEEFGLMAYVEEMHLRKSTRDESCIDYIQFGQDDILPFMTIVKSDKYCGEVNGKQTVSTGIVYDDPHGNLLIWISLGGRRPTSYWPIISVVNLTLVVTPYKKDCKKPPSNFLKCGDRDKCIWKNYFCDHHFNCAKDLIPADEDGCSFEDFSSTLDPLAGGEGSNPDSDTDGEGGYKLNLVTIVLLALCILLFLPLLAIHFAWRMKKCSRTTSSPCDAHQQPQNQTRSLEELDRLRHSRATEQNVYLPLNPLNSVHNNHNNNNARRNRQLPSSSEEPPPAYEELFPAADAAGEEHIYSQMTTTFTNPNEEESRLRQTNNTS